MSLTHQLHLPGEKEINSLAFGSDNPEPDKGARQDLKDEADINWLLRRHGVQGLFSGQASAGFGEQDFDLLADRTLVLQRRSDLAAAYTPPKGMEKELPDLDSFLSAIQDGRISIVPADSVTGVPPVTEAAAASESAPAKG